MFWALGALLLQVPAIPQIAALAAPAVSVEAKAPERDLGASHVRADAAAEAAAASKDLTLEAPPAPGAVTALEPGRLTPTPVAVTGSPAASGSSPSAALPAAMISDARLPVSELRGQRLAWVGLAAAQHSAAAFDAWSTRRAISTGQARELNPLLRPFAGNNSIYAATQVTPALLDYLGWRMMSSRHGWARKTWWLPQVLGTTASVFAGVHNLGSR